MPDLLLELFSEEIPARMQEAAAKDLERLIVGALSDRGLMFDGAKAFSGPRRLALSVLGLPAKQPDVSEEKKGPRIGAPEKAIEGFLRSAGVTLDQCEKRNDGKGEFYVAVIARKGRATADVLAEVLPDVFAKLPWPKSMRFPGSIVRWVRPLHSILCTFDGEVVPFEFAGVKSGNTTLGHRFLSRGPIEVRRFEDYEEKLRKAHVILDTAERKEIILHEVKQKAFALGLELIEDEGLLNEVAGLAEWPIVLIGRIEDQFMDVPPEILQTSMRTHQKYFALRDPKTGKLANRFALVSNMVADDGGKEIVAGNERVLRARLSDAKFFWDQDRKRTLESRVDDLKNIVFHAKLGTQYERVERIEALAGEIAAKIGADVEKSRRAAHLCKADLTTGVVGEFPELQGVMGRYYALHDGEDAEVADAIRDHYKPQGPGDVVPASKVSIAVALADKLDQLVGFFGIDEKPTGSSDPYAIRRAALGLIRTVLERNLRISILRGEHARSLYSRVAKSIQDVRNRALLDPNRELIRNVSDQVGSERMAIALTQQLDPDATATKFLNNVSGLGVFIADRLKVALREKGTRHDLIDAVFSLGDEDDLVRLVARVEALQGFLKTEDGTNLLAGYKRAVNIVKAEEKKDGFEYAGLPETPTNAPLEEHDLATALQKIDSDIGLLINAEKFVEAMKLLAGLRKPVDAFFEKVRVNDEDKNIRANRLMLLSRLRATLHLVADFSKIEG
ncbi:MAG TPA: glycine--tRNA ligase subunit beta [Rhizomicrobium sp.]|jgi:glycyl-tRNA synthetase beta chain|nr:glycine--tRNA ligase subunit beta [Rhizomicrobium sp.]